MAASTVALQQSNGKSDGALMVLGVGMDGGAVEGDHAVWGRVARLSFDSLDRVLASGELVRAGIKRRMAEGRDHRGGCVSRTHHDSNTE